ncbi:hypothetical protein V3C99_016814 [Haemonchus contortus]
MNHQRRNSTKRTESKSKSQSGSSESNERSSAGSEDEDETRDFEQQNEPGNKDKSSEAPPTAQEGPPLIPEERQKNFVVRPGFAYFLVTIPFVQGQRFGLGVKHYRNMVIVSKAEEGSSVADIIKVMDRICDVCSMPVSDKDVCKSMIIRALKYAGEVDMIIERPMEPEAIKMMENALNASQMQEPSVAMAPDVKSIVRRYQEKLKQGHGQMPARKAITDPNKPQANAPHVVLGEGAGKSHISLIIGCDRTPSQVNKLHKVKPKLRKPPSE